MIEITGLQPNKLMTLTALLCYDIEVEVYQLMQRVHLCNKFAASAVFSEPFVHSASKAFKAE